MTSSPVLEENLSHNYFITIPSQRTSEKPVIDSRERPLQYLANEAYYFCSEKGFLTNLSETERAYAYGVIAGAAVAILGNALLQPSSRFIRTCEIGTLATEYAPKIIVPEKDAVWRKQNPRYSSGVDGVRDGAVLIAEIVLAFRSFRH